MDRRSPRRIPWYRKVLFALLPSVLLFAMLESGLRLAGMPTLAETRDPFVGFSAQLPLFQEQLGPQQQPLMVTAPDKRVWFNEQAFAAHKPAGTMRVFCLGGSTTYGRPYWDKTSYCGWLRELLPKMDEHRQWEVINAGGVSYASYRVAQLMQELADYEPDLFIVYTAHNEFLERRTYAQLFARPAWLLGIEARLSQTCTFSLIDRLVRNLTGRLATGPRQAIGAGQGSRAGQSSGTHQAQSTGQPDLLPAEVDESLNHSVGPTDYHRDAVWRAQVLQHYRYNLQRMVRTARRAGAKILFVTPAANESDCSPFKSELRPGLTQAEQLEFESCMQSSREALSAGHAPPALIAIQQALAIDPLHPEAHYRHGQALVLAAQPQAAHQAFVAAMDNDICPLRAVTEISDSLRQVAQQMDVPLVDFERLLHEKCQAELGRPSLGGEYFLDHVHPTLDVHRQLSLWIIDSMLREELVSGLAITDPRFVLAVQLTQKRVEASLDTQTQGIALRNLAKVLHWSGKYAEAAPRAKDALDLMPQDLESRFILADCLANQARPQAAREQYELLFQHGDFPRAYLPYAELLVANDEWQLAKSYALLALLFKPQNAYAYYLLGEIHLALGEHQFAIESLEQSLALSPESTATRKLLQQARQTNP